ncbi:MAG: O-antigen ligase family protein [Mariprofundales bacterium]|nr:O-antigen ligase family protein [Mariprofundales bacterium]
MLPFSIGLSNIIFTLTIILSISSREWWQGALYLHEHYRWLLRAWLIYMTLFITGLAWSPDIEWGIHLLSKQWSWLLVPALLGVLLGNHRDPFFLRYNLIETTILALSAALFIHLIVCSIQSLGLLPNLNPGVSSAQDATGMLGRIGFGLIYSIWAALLIHWGMQQHNWLRITCWSVALWAVVAIFLAQGRSGYLITLVLAILLARKLLFHSVPRLKFWLITLIVCTVFAVTIWQSTAVRHRMQWTLHNIQQVESGNLNKSEARLVMWYGAWRGWLEHPWIGVGTGGFPTLSRQMAKQFNLTYDGKSFTAHPHQMYLLALVRWGPLGLLTLIALLTAWIATGWRNMELSHYNTLIVASGAALTIHGFSAPSLEEYYGSIYGALFLSIGLAGKAIQQGSDRA